MDSATAYPLPNDPAILTTTVGSYPAPSWLLGAPGEEALLDAMRVVFATQRQAGIDLPTDGELYRFDPHHPETNGMIDYFVGRFAGTSTAIGRSDAEAFRQKKAMGFRVRPAAVVTGALGEGSLDLLSDCQRAASVAGGPFKFTVTSPYMLARTLLDRHYGDLEALTLAIADLLHAQVRDLPCACLQIDEANVPGHPDDGPLAARAINRVLDGFAGETAVHFCFGNYGGQTVQEGSWRPLIAFLNRLDCDHLVLEIKRRPETDLQALADVDTRIDLGIGVIDIKSNPVETPDEVAAAIEAAERTLGPGRVRWVHPDCGFWMLHRAVVDRKITALVAGRDKYLGR